MLKKFVVALFLAATLCVAPKVYAEFPAEDKKISLKRYCPEERQWSHSHSEQLEWNYKFGLKVQEAVRNKDLDGLFALVDGELRLGPSRGFIQGKTFDEVFSSEWRDSILADPPPCETIDTWSDQRSLILGDNGNEIVYWMQQGEDTEQGHVVAIHGALEEQKEQTELSWLYNGEDLSGDCLSTLGPGESPYAYSHKQFADDIPWDEFERNIGLFIGSRIPFPPVEDMGDPMASPQFINKLPDGCSQTYDNNSYKVLSDISPEYCVVMAPYFAGRCKEVKFLSVTSGGGMMRLTSYSIYARVNDAESGDDYIITLVDFGNNQNDGWNYLEELRKKQ